MRTGLARTFARPHEPVMFKIREHHDIPVVHPDQMIAQSFHILPFGHGPYFISI